jgi:hypothetical protein
MIARFREAPPLPRELRASFVAVAGEVERASAPGPAGGSPPRRVGGTPAGAPAKGLPPAPLLSHEDDGGDAREVNALLARAAGRSAAALSPPQLAPPLQVSSQARSPARLSAVLAAAPPQPAGPSWRDTLKQLLQACSAGAGEGDALEAWRRQRDRRRAALGGLFGGDEAAPAPAAVARPAVAASAAEPPRFPSGSPPPSSSRSAVAAAGDGTATNTVQPRSPPPVRAFGGGGAEESNFRRLLLELKGQLAAAVGPAAPPRNSSAPPLPSLPPRPLPSPPVASAAVSGMAPITAADAAPALSPSSGSAVVQAPEPAETPPPLTMVSAVIAAASRPMDASLSMHLPSHASSAEPSPVASPQQLLQAHAEQAPQAPPSSRGAPPA